MKNWGYAVNLYMGDYKDCLPLFCRPDLHTTTTDPYIFEILAPYVAKQITSYAQSTVQSYELRRLPGWQLRARTIRRPRHPPNGIAGSAPCFGGYGDPLTGPFYLRLQRPAASSPRP